MIDAPPGGIERPDTPGLQVHFLDGQPLLFDERRQKLYAADRTAAFVLCCLQDGLDIEAIARKLAEAASLNPSAARLVVQEALSQLKTASSGGLDAAGLGAAPEPVSGASPFSGAQLPQPRSPAFGPECLVAIAGFRVRLTCPDRAVARRVLSTFAHLATGDGSSPPDLRIEIQTADGAYVVYQDGVPVLQVTELEGLTPALKAQLVQCVLAREDYRLAVHAAALSRGDHVLLLPGDAGSGKSTLTAALLARGFSLLGDDTVLLEDDFRVRGLPFALAVKAGAWDLLKPYHPSLFGLPVDRRPDGRVVRYLRPVKMETRSLPVRWLVFPSWQRTSDPRLKSLSRVEALKRFLPGCYAAARRLPSDDVARLIAWIEGIDCYTLDSSDLPGALKLIDQVCR
jgi:hypothetical protein